VLDSGSSVILRHGSLYPCTPPVAVFECFSVLIGSSLCQSQLFIRIPEIVILCAFLYRAGFLKGAAAAVVGMKGNRVPGFLLLCLNRYMTLGTGNNVALFVQGKI